MTIEHQISWLIEGHIVLSISPEESSAEDMLALDAEYIKYLDQAQDDQLHFIFDLSHQKTMPPLKAMNAMKFMQHPEFGWSVIVGGLHPLVKTLVTLVGKIQGKRFRLMDTTENAHEFLLAMYPAIIPSSQTDVEHS